MQVKSKIGNPFRAGCEKLARVPEERWSPFDKICAALLALCQILQHYEGPIFNAAITLMVLLAPYVALRMLSRLEKLSFAAFGIVLATVVYQAYKVINHGTSLTELGQSGVVAFYLLAAVAGAVDVKFLVKTAATVAVTAAGCLVVQYIGFYLLHKHLQLVPTELLIPSASQWILLAQTGQANINGAVTDFYRPSAFFLEPSHLFIYSFPHLFLTLFSSEGGRKKYILAGLISLGMVLCTSGMAIAAVAGAWVLFFALYNEKDGSFRLRNLVRKRNLVALAVVFAVLVVLVLSVPSIRRTVFRIFFTDSDSSTAIGGRVNKAFALLKDMTLAQWIHGVSDFTHGIKFNVPGLMSVIYRHGLVGLVLAYELYVKSVWKLKLPYMLVAAVILVTSCFSAHTHSTMGFLYYSFILLSGYLTAQRSVLPQGMKGQL